jgi:hypothetical protein
VIITIVPDGIADTTDREVENRVLLGAADGSAVLIGVCFSVTTAY